MMTKKHILGLLLTNILLLFVSCSNELGQTPNSPTTKTTERTLDEIIAIAEKAPSIFAANDATRGGYQATKKVDISSIRALNISDGTTRTQSEESSLYAINYQDNDGYVLISTNTNTPGVIAYIDEGQYDLNEINDNNTDIGYVTDMANNYISNLPPIDKFVPIDKPDTVTFKIHPFLTTKWGQRDPEGIYSP